MKTFSIILLVMIPYIVSAQSIIDSLENELGKSMSDTNRVKILERLSFYLASVDQNAAINYGEQGIALAMKIKFNEYLPHCYINIGIAYWYLGNYSEAYSNYNKSLLIYRELGDSLAIGRCYNNMGLILWNKGEYSEALNQYIKSLKIMEVMDNKSELISVYNNVGMVYHELKKYEEAITFYMKSLELNNKLGNPESGILISNIGEAYLRLKDYLRSDEYIRKSLTIFNQENNESGMATSYNNLGEINVELGNLHEALKNYQMALELRIKNNNEKDIIISYYSLGKIYYELEDYNFAIHMVQNSLEISKKLGNRKEIRDAYNLLAICYSKQSLFDKAYFYKELFSSINDSLFSENSSKQIAEMQTKYETEKKEQEIEKLVAENELHEARLKQDKILMISGGFGFVLIVITLISLILNLRRKQKTKLLSAKIVGMEQEKSAISKELHDGVCNNVSTILTDLHNINHEKTPFIEVQLSFLLNDIRNISSELGKSKPGYLSLPDEIYDYIQRNLSGKNIEYSFNVHPKEGWEIPSDIYHTLIRILQNAIQNIIKHSKATKANVQLVKQADNINMIIEDNGCGLIENPESKGYGILNIKERVKSMNGKVEFDSHIDRGTIINVNIPVSKLINK